MKKLVIANWKMNGQPAMAEALTRATAAQAAGFTQAGVVICPPAPLLMQVGQWLAGTPVKLGGQDCHTRGEGAYTGDISAELLKNVGCDYVIVGHSERRAAYSESDVLVQAKASRAILSGLTPVICIGETIKEREAGRTQTVVGQQVRDSIPDNAMTTGGQPANFVLAYEPVWAIGSGKTPTVDDIRQMHQYIVSVASERTGHAPEAIMVLYGGSVKAANARAIMATPAVSGVLVGGASLKAEEFCGIIAAV
jgi:triosephosphate isomerase (TIM)